MNVRANGQNPLTKNQLTLLLEESREMGVISLREKVAYALLTLLMLNTVSVLAIIFLVGFHMMALPERLILTLIGETVAQAAAIFFSIIQSIFPKGR